MLLEGNGVFGQCISEGFVVSRLISFGKGNLLVVNYYFPYLMFYLISLFSCSPFLPPFLPSPLPHFKMFLNCYWRLFCIPDKIPTKHPGASCGMDVTTVIVVPGTHWQGPGSNQFPNPGNSFLRREFCLKFQKKTLILSCSVLAFMGFFFLFQVWIVSWSLQFCSFPSLGALTEPLVTFQGNEIQLCTAFTLLFSTLQISIQI